MRDHGKPPPVAQQRDQILGDALGEVDIVGRISLVRERQHGDCGTIQDGGEAALRHRRRHSAADLEHPHGVRQVLKSVLAEIIEAHRDVPADLPHDVLGDADRPWSGQRLQARREIHPFAVDLAVLLDDVTKMDPEAESDASLWRYFRRCPGHGLLDGDAARHRGDDAVELDESAVAHQLGETTVVRGKERVDDLGTVALERGQRARLVLAHETAVAHDVGGEDGEQATQRDLPDAMSPGDLARGKGPVSGLCHTIPSGAHGVRPDRRPDGAGGRGRTSDTGGVNAVLYR